MDLALNPTLGDRDAVSLLRMFPGLVRLDLTGTKMGDAALEVFALTGKLTSLRCDRCGNISDMGLSRVLQRLPLLQHLSAAETKAGDLSLYAAGLSCGELETVRVPGCAWITDAGAKAVLEGCRALRTLDIAACPKISLESSAVIASILRSGVSRLWLQGCEGVPDDALRVLAKAKPEFRSAASGQKGSIVRFVCGLALGRRWGTGQPRGEAAHRSGMSECAVLVDRHAVSVGAARFGADKPLREMDFLPRSTRQLAMVEAARKSPPRYEEGIARSDPSQPADGAKTNADLISLAPSSRQRGAARDSKEKVEAILGRGSKMSRRVKALARTQGTPSASSRNESTLGPLGGLPHGKKVISAREGGAADVLNGQQPAMPEAEGSEELVSDGESSDWSDWSLSDVDLSPQPKQKPASPPEERPERTGEKLGFGTQSRRFS